MDRIVCLDCDKLHQRRGCRKACKDDTKPTIEISDVVTREQALEFWRQSKVEYTSFRAFDILEKYIRDELKKKSVNVRMHLSKCGSRRFNNGKFVEGFIGVTSNYFIFRRVIEMQDGEVHFKGWMDENTVVPFVRAFVRWIEYMR
jgi:hypothetical protein